MHCRRTATGAAGRQDHAPRSVIPAAGWGDDAAMWGSCNGWNVPCPCGPGDPSYVPGRVVPSGTVPHPYAPMVPMPSSAWTAIWGAVAACRGLIGEWHRDHRGHRVTGRAPFSMRKPNVTIRRAAGNLAAPSIDAEALAGQNQARGNDGEPKARQCSSHNCIAQGGTGMRQLHTPASATFVRGTWLSGSGQKD